MMEHVRIVQIILILKTPENNANQIYAPPEKKSLKQENAWNVRNLQKYLWIRCSVFLIRVVGDKG